MTDTRKPAAASNAPQTSQRLVAAGDDIATEGDITRFKGQVQISIGDATLSAREARVDNRTGEVTAEGGLSYRSPSVNIQSERLHARPQDSSLLATGAEYQVSGQAARGKAASIRVQDGKNMVLEDGEFTTCPKEKESWKISAGRIAIDADRGLGQATNMVLYLGDIPVLWLPYLIFPATSDRSTGLLAPSVDTSDINGQEIATPLYLNLAPNYDATLTPRWMSRRGTLLETEFRYLTEHHQGQVETGYLDNDRLVTPPITDTRFRFHWKQHSHWGANWKSDIDIENVSDDNYFFDMGRDLASASVIQLNRRISLSYADSFWDVRTIVSSDDTLNTPRDPYRRLPQIAFRYRPSPVWRDWSWSLTGEATVFDRDNATTADRFYLEPSFTWSREGLSGFLRATGSVNIRHYEQKQANGETRQDSIVTPVISLDSGIYLEREHTWFGKRWLQTLEPRAFYLYVPYRNQQALGIYDTSDPLRNYRWLFRTNRYTGLDRLGDSEQISVGVSSRLMEQATGRELLRWGIGQAFYLRDRKVTLASTVPDAVPVVEDLSAGESPILADLQLSWADAWQASAALEWEPNRGRTDSASFRLQYRPDDVRVMNLGHRTRNLPNGERLEQAEFSSAWRISDHWHLLGRYNRDLRNRQDVEWIAGVVYEDCCWALRVVSRRYLNVALDTFGQPLPGLQSRYNSGIYVEFVLKGMTSLGNTGFLENSIAGYSDPFAR